MPNLKSEPVRVEIEGKYIKCLICDHDHFHKRRIQVDTAMLSGMTPEWHHNSGFGLFCDRCGFIHWFVQK